MFITFEGTEGVGKTTQMGILAQRLLDAGKNVLVTRQPGGEPLGIALRRLMLEQTAILIAPTAEMLMMMADRAQSVATIIKPALAEGKTVLCDRYIDSSAAYQGHGRGLDLAAVRILNEIATGGLVPDLTFLLDADPATALARQFERNNMERESLAFHQRVRSGFLAAANAEPHRFAVIDASGAIGSVAERIWERYEANHLHRTQ